MVNDRGESLSWLMGRQEELLHRLSITKMELKLNKNEIYKLITKKIDNKETEALKSGGGSDEYRFYK